MSNASVRQIVSGTSCPEMVTLTDACSRSSHDRSSGVAWSSMCPDDDTRCVVYPSLHAIPTPHSGTPSARADLKKSPASTPNNFSDSPNSMQ